MNDPSDLKRHIWILTRQRRSILRSKGYEETTFASTKHHMGKIFPALEAIYESDLSQIYDDKIEQNYYVYVHCDPSKKLNLKSDVRNIFLASKFGLTHVPFYVGKGTGNRWMEFSRNDSHRKIRSKILAKNLEIMPVKIIEKITEGEALAYESKLIDILGLRSLSKHGFLVNLDEGADKDRRRSLYPKDPIVRNILKLNGH